MFATTPGCLTAFPLLGREEALFNTFASLFHRWFVRQGNDGHSDRTQNPFILIPGSPGLGKSRLLNVLSRIPRAPSPERLELFRTDVDNVGVLLQDDELKYAVLVAIRENLQNVRGCWVYATQSDFGQFCDIMLNRTCGIVITFYEPTYLLSEEREEILLPTEMLGARVAFVTQLLDGCKYSTFEGFWTSLQNVLGDQRPTLDWALDLLETKYGPESHFILCVDEMLRGAGLATHEQYLNGDGWRLERILNEIGIQLDKRKNLHVILTSLSYMWFTNLQTASGRNIRAISLRNLTFRESKTLARWYQDALLLPPQNQWSQDDGAMQMVDECNGAPRLLEHVFFYLRPNHSIQKLREMCSHVAPISALCAYSNLMLVAILFALRKEAPTETGERKAFDEAVFMGYLSNSSVPEGVEPILPQLTMSCVLQRALIYTSNPLFGIRELNRYLSEPGNHDGKQLSAPYFAARWLMRLISCLFQIRAENESSAIATIAVNLGHLTMRYLLASHRSLLETASPVRDPQIQDVFDLQIQLDPRHLLDELCKGVPTQLASINIETLYKGDVPRLFGLPRRFGSGRSSTVDLLVALPIPGERVMEGRKCIAVCGKVALFLFVMLPNELDARDMSLAGILSLETNWEYIRQAVNDQLFGLVLVVSGSDTTVDITKLKHDLTESLTDTPEIRKVSSTISIATLIMAR